MKQTIYAGISTTTLEAARDRAYKDLESLTDGAAEKALQIAKEYMELKEVIEK